MLLIHGLGLLLLALWVWHQNQPVALPNLPGPAARLQCVSYSPYHLPGQSPLDPQFVVPPSQIAADLAHLAPLTACVRIYSVAQGLDQVLPLARRLGLKVLLGAWISSDPTQNARELDRAITLANAYPETVQALIVGNEVLLRRELSEGDLRQLILSAKARTRVPVTYADVWEFWRQHRGLETAVDLVTVHILPFWEDQPIPVAQGVAHVDNILTRLGQEFHKPLLIGETGWPSAGRQREGARPGQVEQARFFREFMAQAQKKGWRYNFIEAIDQPWKRNLEGTVGGYWGILEASTLAPKFPLEGPVAETRNARAVTLAALGGALLFLWLGIGFQWPGGSLGHVARGTMGALAGGLALLQYQHGLEAYRNLQEGLALGATSALGLAIALLLARQPALTTRAPTASLAWTALFRRFFQGARAGEANWPEGGTGFALGRGLLLFAAAVGALLLAVDPRYRDFPTLLYLLPAAQLGLLRLGIWRLDGASAISLGPQERFLAGIIALGGVARWLQEPTNGEAVLWLVTCLVLAGSGLGRPSKATPRRKCRA